MWLLSRASQCNSPDSTNTITNEDRNTTTNTKKIFLIQCNPPDETVPSTNTNTNSDRNTEIELNIQNMYMWLLSRPNPMQST